MLYGLEQSEYLRKNSILELEHPSLSGRKLISGQADIGLIPVAFLTQLEKYKIISETCIATDQYMPSVLLSSQVPMNEVEKIWLDYHSASSVNLVKILAENFWKISPVWLKSANGYENKIHNRLAGVIIGDRALKYRSRFSYNYDLSAEWYKFTGLPFVFACWVTTKDLDPEFLMEFEKALHLGIDHLDEVVRIEEKKYSFPNINIEEYLKVFLKFKLDIPKKEGMKLFLNYLSMVSPY